MGDFLNKNFVWILAAGVGIWFYRKADDKAKEITKPIGQALAQVTMFFNGNSDIKYTNAGFFLNPEKLDSSLKVIGGKNSYWYRAILLAHDAHKQFLDEIFDSDLRLKNQYKKLLNGRVDAETIETAARGW